MIIFRYKYMIVPIIALIFFLIYMLSNGQKSDSNKKPLTVNVVQVRTGTDAQMIEAVGTATAAESVTISARITEYVRRLHFEDGDVVKKGQVLVELEDREEQAQLDDARARLQEARLQYRRVANLHKKNFSAQSEHDTAQANLLSAEARLKQIEAVLANRVIKAPFDGVLGFRQISEGTLVEPSDEIVTLDMIQPINIDFNIPEKFLSEVKKGQTFKATSPAWPDQPFNGSIETINVRIDDQARSVVLRGIIDNKDLRIRPGMFLRVLLALKANKVLQIPEAALLASGMSRFVYRYDEQNQRAEKVQVHVLKRQGDIGYIKSELKANSWVIINAGFKMFDGQEVQVNHVDF